MCFLLNYYTVLSIYNENCIWLSFSEQYYSRIHLLMSCDCAFGRLSTIFLYYDHIH